jgi:IclR family transcriptional regulator, pca regulon regulatory protein
VSGELTCERTFLDAAEGGADPVRPSAARRQPRYSRSLERGLAILACFTPELPLLGIAELAEQLDMNRSTTHRYVSTLVSLGYLEQDGSRKYRLALGAVDLGSGLNATGLCKHARPLLEALSRHTGYTAQIAVLDGPEILLVDRIPPSGTAYGSNQEHELTAMRLPAYCTSIGKVLLASLPSEQRAKLISEMKLVQRGPGTITDKASLLAQLEEVQREGVATADEEMLEGSRAIAAPVRDGFGDVVAAVGLVAYDSKYEMDHLVARYRYMLLTAASRISGHLGWRGAGE